MAQTQPRAGHLHGSKPNKKDSGGAIVKETQAKPGHLHGAAPAKKDSGGSLPDPNLNRGYVDRTRKVSAKRVNDHVRKSGGGY